MKRISATLLPLLLVFALIMPLQTSAEELTLDGLLTQVNSLNQKEYTYRSWSSVQSVIAFANQVASGKMYRIYPTSAPDQAWSVTDGKSNFYGYSTEVQFRAFTGEADQLWYKNDTGDGYYQIINANGKYLTYLGEHNLKMLSLDEIQDIDGTKFKGGNDDAIISKGAEKSGTKNYYIISPATNTADKVELDFWEQPVQSYGMKQDQNAPKETIDAMSGLLIPLLQQAIDGLVKNYTTASENYPKITADLEAAKAAAAALNAADYTPESWKVLQDAVASSAKATNKSSQNTVDDKTTAINTAVSRLILAKDMAGLKDIIATAETYSEEMYTPASWQTFTDAIAEAMKYVDSVKGTNAEIQAQTSTIDKILNGYWVKDETGHDLKIAPELVKKANKESLAAQLKLVSVLNEADFEETAWSFFRNSLFAAEEVYDDANTLQSNVDQSVMDLAISAAELLRSNGSYSAEMTIASGSKTTDSSITDSSNVEAADDSSNVETAVSSGAESTDSANLKTAVASTAEPAGSPNPDTGDQGVAGYIYIAAVSLLAMVAGIVIKRSIKGKQVN